MPTMLSCTAIIHLSNDPELKEYSGGTLLKLRGYTKDRVKNRDSGQYENEFTNVDATVFGIEVEWLHRDAKKGSLVAVAGTARVRGYNRRDGTAGAALEFTRVASARCLELSGETGQRGGEYQAARKPQAIPAPAPSTDTDEPPF